jgi:hypothetical protein
MHDRYSRRWRRTRDFEALESKQLLTALVGSPAKLVPQAPQLASGEWAIDFPGDRFDPEASARRFLTTIAEQISIRPDTRDLLAVEVKHGLASSHVRFQQSLLGMEVHGATVTVNLDPDGAIQNYYATTFADLTLPASVAGKITFHEAEQLARHTAQIESEYLPAKGRLVWLALQEGPARLAWRIEAYAHQPVGDFVTLLDALSGEIYTQENRTPFDEGSGHAFWPNPYQTQGHGAGLADSNDANSPTLAQQRVSVGLQGLDSGTGLLRGEFVDLASLNSYTLADVDADEPTRVYDYTRDDPRFEQVVVYQTVDSIQRYFHALVVRQHQELGLL